MKPRKYRLRIRLHRKIYDLLEMEALWQDSKIGTLANRILQEELAKLEGVKSVSVNFMTQKLTLEADDAEFDEVLNRVVEFTADAEPDCEIIL